MSTITLPSAGSATTKSYGKFTEPVRRPVEPVGRFFLGHAARTVRGHTWSEYEQLEAAKNVKAVAENDDGLDLDEEQPPELLAHDPRDWKSADLYAALGLSKYRYRATQENVRAAYRKAVLKHHPDKMAEKGSGLDKDGFFKIVTKAYETLMDPIQRKRYDSVDPYADIAPPPAKSSYDFYEAWGPVFESEARFSKKQPVPALGGPDAEKKDVEAFYSFWYQFDSWRTFEFADEDVPDDSLNRDHKRYIERKNKAARDKKKTEDNKRILKLVDRAISEDPRIKKFKQQEKEEKARRKWEREAGSRKAAEEAKAKAEAEAKAKAEAEAKAKAERENKKKSKEAAKSAKKKNKRAIRNSAKEQGYYGDADKAETIDGELELLLGSFDDETLALVAAKIGEGKSVLVEAASELVKKGAIPEGAIKYFV